MTKGHDHLKLINRYKGFNITPTSIFAHPIIDSNHMFRLEINLKSLQFCNKGIKLVLLKILENIKDSNDISLRCADNATMFVSTNFSPFFIMVVSK